MTQVKSVVKSIATGLHTTAVRNSVALSVAFLATCSMGCTSSGTLQPHHAFRQATAPYQGYYQGQQPAYGPVAGSADPAAGDYSGYGGYNDTLPGYDRHDPATRNFGSGSFGAYSNQFANPYGSLNGGQVYTQGGYQQYSPNTGHHYQPAYTGGLTSGSC